MKVDLLLWLAAFPCAIPPLPSWRRAHRERKEERKTNTRCSHPRKLMGTPGGSARIPGRAERRSGSAPGVAGRAARAAGSPGWLARAQPLAPARPAAWLRPSAAANCISPPPPAAPVRNVGRRQPLGGRAGLVLVLRPDVSAPRSAPGVCGTCGCGPRRL